MSDLFDRAPGQRFQDTPAAQADWAADSATAGRPAGPDAPPPRLAVERYRVTRWWVPVLIIVLVAALIGAMVWFGTRPPAAPSGSDTPTTSTTKPAHTPPPGGQGIDFGNSSSGPKGYWEILGYTWDDRGVTLDCRLTVDKGTLRYQWTALDNASSDQFDPAYSSTLFSGTLTAGQSAEGTVRFNKPRGATLVLLADNRGYAITALGVDG